MTAIYHWRCNVCCS